MPKSPIIELTMSAMGGYDAQPVFINARNVSAIHRYRRKVSEDLITVHGTCVCTGVHDFVVDEDYEAVLELVMTAIG